MPSLGPNLTARRGRSRYYAHASGRSLRWASFQASHPLKQPFWRCSSVGALAHSVPPRTQTHTLFPSIFRYLSVLVTAGQQHTGISTWMEKTAPRFPAAPTVTSTVGGGERQESETHGLDGFLTFIHSGYPYWLGNQTMQQRQ